MSGMEEVRVSAQSDPQAMAGAVAALVRRDGATRMVAVGVPSVATATKAATIARGYLLAHGIDIGLVPSFRDVTFGQGEQRTAVVLDIVQLDKEE